MLDIQFRRVFLGIVFAVLPLQQASAGFVVDVFEDIVTGSAIQTAIDAMNAAGSPDTSDHFNVINLAEGDSPLGNFGSDHVFPGFPDNNFGVHASGFISTGAGINYFGINHDDGARLLIDGFEVINFSAPTPPRNSFGSILLTAGIHTVDFWLYENGGVVSMEFFESDKEDGVGELIRSVPEPSTVLLLGLGLVGLGFARKRLD